MTTLVTATLSTTDLLRVAASLGLAARELDRAAVTAVNDTAKKARGLARKSVRAYLTLPAKSVNDRIDVVKKASKSNLSATVSIGRRARDNGTGGNVRPTLMSFKGEPKEPRREALKKAKYTKKGKLTKGSQRKLAPFSYQITRGGTRKLLPGGFVQRPTKRFNLNKGGFDSVTDQKAQAFKRKGAARYPLVAPRGPSIAAVWQADDRNTIADGVMRETREFLPQRMQQQSERILNRVFRRSRVL